MLGRKINLHSDTLLDAQSPFFGRYCSKPLHIEIDDYNIVAPRPAI